MNFVEEDQDEADNLECGTEENSNLSYNLHAIPWMNICSLCDAEFIKMDGFGNHGGVHPP
jgi:hypothetical protein